MRAVDIRIAAMKAAREETASILRGLGFDHVRDGMDAISFFNDPDCVAALKHTIERLRPPNNAAISAYQKQMATSNSVENGVAV